jgi:adenylate cyclase
MSYRGDRAERRRIRERIQKLRDFRIERKQTIVGYILGAVLGLLVAVLHKNGCSLPGW